MGGHPPISVFLVSLLLGLWGAGEAGASTVEAEARLAEAQDAFLDVEYETALQALVRAEEHADATDEQLARLFALRGTIQFLLGHEEQGRTTYARLLALFPGFRLPDSHPPRAAEFLDSIRMDIAPPVTIHHTAPRRFLRSEPMEIAAEIRGVTEGHSVRLLYRTVGADQYTAREMAGDSADRFRYVGQIQIESSSSGSDESRAVEYFIVVSQGDDRVANEGTPRRPHVVSLHGTTGEERPGLDAQPLWRTWWFWTILGGAAVAVAGVALGVALGIQNETPTGSAAVTLRFED